MHFQPPTLVSYLPPYMHKSINLAVSRSIRGTNFSVTAVDYSMVGEALTSISHNFRSSSIKISNP